MVAANKLRRLLLCAGACTIERDPLGDFRSRKWIAGAVVKGYRDINYR